MRRVVVASSPHAIPVRPPIRVDVGDQVNVGERDSEWPAFVFVTAQNGSGWVPECHLDRQSSSAVVTQAYDTTELPTEEGQELEALHEDFGQRLALVPRQERPRGLGPGAHALTPRLISRASL